MVDKQQIHETIRLLEKVSHTNLHDLIQAKNAVHRTLRLLGTETLDTAFASIIESLPALAESLGKLKPKVVIDNDQLLLKTQSVGFIKDIFTHLIRNCVDHGLESAAERILNGKLAHGCINIYMQMEIDRLKIAIKDDGRGIALSKIRQNAFEKGLIEADANLNDAETATLIFLPGFSTAEQVTDISGRGVGMDAVLGFAKKEGGSVKINFLDSKEGFDFRAFEIALYLPPDCAVLNDEPARLTELVTN